MNTNDRNRWTPGTVSGSDPSIFKEWYLSGAPITSFAPIVFSFGENEDYTNYLKTHFLHWPNFNISIENIGILRSAD